MKKDDFVNELMSALDTTEKVAPPLSYHRKIAERLDIASTINNKFSYAVLFGIAASLLLLITVNIVILGNIQPNESNLSSDVSTVDNYIPSQTLYHE